MFLQAAASEAKNADAFFNRFEYFQRLRERNYSAALDQGINLLATCKQIDADAYRNIHKDRAFYLARSRRIPRSRLPNCHFFFRCSGFQGRSDRRRSS